ncbi:MAG: dTDP-4-dehydrorhamnose reductase [Candidatus Margulisiibacteriota bacterium]
MKFLVIGADGQLGTDLLKIIPKKDAVPLTLKDLDITDRSKVNKVVQEYRPEVIINTAGYSRVDEAESNSGLAFAVNAEGAKNLAAACQEVEARLVHISTDYVFNGQKHSPYQETDRPEPLSVYARSKLAGEEAIAQLSKRHFIVRSSGLFGVAGCLGKGGGNFIDSVIAKGKSGEQFSVVDDQFFSPTYTLDLARKIYQLVQTDHFGLYHIVNRGACSWYELALKAFELAGLKVNFSASKFAELNARTPAKRPAFSALDNANLRAIGLDELRPWQEALRAYMLEKGIVKQ